MSGGVGGGSTGPGCSAVAIAALSSAADCLPSPCPLTVVAAGLGGGGGEKQCGFINKLQPDRKRDAIEIGSIKANTGQETMHRFRGSVHVPWERGKARLPNTASQKYVPGRAK